MRITFHLREKPLYRMVNALLLFGICLFGAGNYLGVASVTAWNVAAGAGVLVLLAVFDSVDGKGRLLEGAGIVGCLGATIVVVGLENCIDFMANYGRWLLGITPWQKEWLAGYGILQSFIAALVCHLVQMILDKDFRCKAVVALLVLAGLVYCFFAEKKLPQAGVVLAICYLVMVLAELLQRHWKKVRSKSIQAYMLWLLPFFVLYLVALWKLPMPEQPYDWQFFKDIYSKVSESVKTSSHNLFHMGREDFDSGLSGFSAEGKVGSGVEKDVRQVMSIRSNISLKTNVYLTGKIYDTFDGKQWKKVHQDIAQEHDIDARNTLYAVRNYAEDHPENYLRQTALNIRYEDFHSRYLFAPLKTWQLEWDDRELGYVEKEGSLQFSEKVGYGMEYGVTYYQLNMGHEAFDEFLRAEQEIPRSEKSAEEWQLYEQVVYDSFLGEVVLSQKTRQYLELVIKDAETKFDKLKCIEEMLSSMKYTRTPEKMPDTVVDGSSFLDYFLLESGQGYCSHFATAFVLLARAEGIPARYVQGYCVPMGASAEILVTSDNAHAWPEVYFDHIGWIPFEPTPGYGSVRYTPWAIVKDAPGGAAEYAPGSGLPGWEGDGNQEFNWELPEPEEEEELIGQKDFGKMFKILLIAVASMLAVGVVILLLDFGINRWRYQRMDLTRKYLVEVQNNMKLLEGLQLKREGGETLEELQNRVKQTLELKKGLKFLEEYEEYLYGSRETDANTLRLVVREQEELLRTLKKRRKVAYYYYRLLLK